MYSLFKRSKSRKSRNNPSHGGLMFMSPMGRSRTRHNPFDACETVAPRRSLQGLEMTVTRGPRAGTFTVVGCGTGSSSRRAFGTSGREYGTYALQYEGKDKVSYVPSRWISKTRYRITKSAALADAAKKASKAEKVAVTAAKVAKAAEVKAEKAVRVERKAKAEAKAVGTLTAKRKAKQAEKVAVKAEKVAAKAEKVAEKVAVQAEKAIAKVEQEAAKVEQVAQPTLTPQAEKLLARHAKLVAEGSPMAKMVAGQIRKAGLSPRANPFMGLFGRSKKKRARNNPMPARSSRTGRFTKRSR